MLEWCNFCAKKQNRYEDTSVLKYRLCSVHQFATAVSYINQRAVNNLLCSTNLYKQIEIPSMYTERLETQYGQIHNQHHLANTLTPTLGV